MYSSLSRFMSVRAIRPFFQPTKRLLVAHKASCTNVDKIPHGRGVEVKWNNGETSRFHSSWLRMNCHCSQCYQDHSGQRVINVSQFPKHLKIADINLSDNSDEITVTWDQDQDHKSLYKLDWLKKHSHSKKDIEDQSSQRKFHTFRESIPKAVNYEDVVHTNAGHLKLLQSINEDGIALVKGVPCNQEKVGEVAEKLGPVLPTIYGKFFDVESTPNPINIAYSSVHLGYHMDLAYYQSPPGIQLLHCLRFDKEVTGGESTFLDVFGIAEQFRKTNPKEFDTLVRVPATFQKIHFKRENPVYLKYQRPHITLNHRKEIVSVTWSPAFEGPLFVEEEDVEPYYEAYFEFDKAINQSDLKLKFSLEEGDVVAFNNIRMLHGREEFELNGGNRHLRGCYVNIDEFRNKVDVMSQLHGDRRLSKRVGNNCFF